MRDRKTTKELVHFSFMVVLLIVMTLTPLGFIHLGLIKATLVHIPVIFASLLYGPAFAGTLGFVFGLLSLITNTLTPSVLSFAFSPFIPVIGTDKGSLWALVIVFVPRILVGVLPHYVKEKTDRPWLAALVGSLTNTVLVLGLIAFIFKDAYAAAMNIEVNTVYRVILGIVASNGLAEAALAVVLVSPLYQRFNRKK